MKLFANNFCFLCCSRKMEWTTEHGMLFCREIIAFDLCQYKPGSKETGQCLDSIAERLDSTEEPGFKVEHRSLQDRMRKFLKLYVEKWNKEMRESSRSRAQRTGWYALWETRTTTASWSWSCKASEVNKKTLEKERQKVEEIWRLSMEYLSETQKRSSNNDEDLYVTSPKQKRSRSSEMTL